MKTRAHLISVCLAAGLLLTACAPTGASATPNLPAGATSAPTVLPLISTAVAATGTALAGAAATNTAPVLAATVTVAPTLPATTVPATAAPVTVPATEAPAASATTAAPTAAPAPTDVPGQPQVPEAILILAPGNGGMVSSPVLVSGAADPTFEQNLVVQITAADGTVLATQPTTIQIPATMRGAFSVQVPFTVTSQQPGWISVFSTSPRDGGLTHLASVDVTLTNGGPVEPIVGEVHDETHIILGPGPSVQVSGGKLHVTGFSDYVFESQLSLALCGAGGGGAPDPVCGSADNVLASGTATLNAPDIGQPGPFAGDLTYHVSAPGPARLAVYSRSARDGGLLHLTTVAIQLAP
jgi:hypothetical protein